MERPFRLHVSSGDCMMVKRIYDRAVVDITGLFKHLQLRIGVAESCYFGV